MILIESPHRDMFPLMVRCLSFNASSVRLTTWKLDDVLRARMKTLGVSEHRFMVRSGWSFVGMTDLSILTDPKVP